MSQRLTVFVSWSGKTSRLVAELLRDWLPKVIQAIEPWMSDNDIEKGERWLEEVTSELEGAALGIVCLTPDNLTSPWLLFEAGALSHRLGRRHVCPFLLGLQPAEVTFPLGQFQATKATQEDVRKLLVTINAALGDDALSIKRLEEAFDTWWPKLKTGLDAIQTSPHPTSQKPLRTDRELLEETLELVRAIKLTPPNASSPANRRRLRSSLVTCPHCKERKVRLGDGNPVCANCAWTQSPEDAADSYARTGDSDWKHPKHGPDDELGACVNCGADAVVHLRDEDKIGYVQQKISALWGRLELEPGAGDAGFSICFSCGDVHYGQPKPGAPSW